MRHQQWDPRRPAPLQQCACVLVPGLLLVGVLAYAIFVQSGAEEFTAQRSSETGIALGYKPLC
jgi:hypothetical protein